MTNSLLPLLTTITCWGDTHMSRILRARTRYDG